MVSAAEQLAANLNFGAFSKAEELKKRIWFTLPPWSSTGSAPTSRSPASIPSLSPRASRQQSSGILGMFNLFAGGAVERMAIFALNIMPYISASIIMQLMTSVVPTLEALKKEGEQGRKQINQYTRYLTVALAAFQAFGIAIGLEGSRGSSVGGDRSRLVLPHLDGDHAGRRHHVPDVARRADHRARRRQRHLAHHLRGHRRRPAERDRGPARAVAHRRDLAGR